MAREQHLPPLLVPSQRDVHASDDTADTESIIETPIQPSEKALGKRRQFSDRGGELKVQDALPSEAYATSFLADAFEPGVQEEALARANAASQLRDEAELRARPPPPVPARVPAPGADAVPPNGIMASSEAAGAFENATPAPLAPQQWAPTNPFHPSALRPGQVQQDASQGTNPFAVRS